MSQAIESPWKDGRDRRLERQIKQEAVLMTAAKIFSTRGYHRTSLDLVAKQLNITKPTLYYYFKNKEALLAACMQHGLEMVDNGAAYAAQEKDNCSAIVKLTTYLESYARFVLTDFGRCAILISDAELSEASKKKIRSIRARIDSQIQSITREGIADGTIASSNPKFTASALAGALNSIAHWSHTPSSSHDRFIAEFIGLLIEGVAPRT